MTGWTIWIVIGICLIAVGICMIFVTQLLTDRWINTIEHNVNGRGERIS